MHHLKLIATWKQAMWTALWLLTMAAAQGEQATARAAQPDEFRIRYFGGIVGREGDRRDGKIVKVDFSTLGVEINSHVMLLLSDCTEIKELNLGGKLVREGLLDAIRNMKGLEVLTLPVGMNNEEFRVIEGLRELKELTVFEAGYGTGITDDGMKSLAKLPKLRKLKLWANKVGDPGLTEIAKVKTLTDLDLNYTKITDAGLPALAKLAQLERLSLVQTEVTPAGLRHLKYLAKLKEVRVSGDAAEVEKALAELGLPIALPDMANSQLPEAAAAPLGIDSLEIQTLRTKWPHIEFGRDSIVIDGSVPGFLGGYFSDDDLKEFAILAGLKQLTITNAPLFKGRGLVHLRACKELERLHLDDRHLTKESLQLIAPIPELRLLEGQSTDLEAVEALRNFKALEELRIINNSNFDDKLLERLENVDKLRCLVARMDYYSQTYALRSLPTRPGLDLQRTKVTDSGLAKFAGNDRIEWVRLSASQLTESGAKTLQTFPNLVTVFAPNVEIQEKLALQLAKVEFLESVGGTLSPAAIGHLAQCKWLRILEIDGATDECLAEAARHQQLAVLRVNGPALTDAGVKQLKALKGLLFLQISDADQVTGIAIRHLDDALPNCTIKRY